MNNNENNRPYIIIGRDGKPMTPLESQNIFLECLEPNMLNEFLLRFQREDIIRDIQEKRLQDNRVNKNIIMESRVAYRPGDTSAYINYYINNTRVFHISFHLCYKKISDSNGMMHFKQNHNRVQLIEVCRKSNTTNKQYPKSLHFCVSKHPHKKTTFNSEYELESKYIVDVLNEYFNEHHEKYVGVKSNKKSYNKLNRIYKNIQNSLKWSTGKKSNRSNNYTRRNKRV
jgi:type III secretory pathway component EscV